MSGAALLLIGLLSFSASVVIVWIWLRWLDPFGYSYEGGEYAAVAACKCGEVASETWLYGDKPMVECEYCGRIQLPETEVWAENPEELRREVERLRRELHTRAKVREYAEKMKEAYDPEGVDAEDVASPTDRAEEWDR